jgi:phosphohistidine phosphatase
MTTLVLLRHAKSAYPSGVADHDRPLNGRGRRDAVVAGQLLTESVGVFDVALVSTAVRAQTTFELAAAALEVRQRRDEPGLYLASPAAMLRRLTDVDAARVLIVAHNPGTEDLAAELTANTGSEAYRRMRTKFPTSAFAVLEAPEPLPQWRAGIAELVEFGIARG